MDGKLLATGKYFLLLSLIAFFYSCSNDSNDNDFRIMNEGLERSNMAIEKSTQTLCHSIQNKLDDPTTSYKAAIWYPKMKMIQEFSKTISDYLEKLKTDVKNEKDMPDERAIELYGHLLKYKHDVLNVDSSLRMEFEDKTIITAGSFDSIKHSADDFLKTFFKRHSPEAIISMLTKYQNNIKIMENRMIQFCSFKIPDPESFYESYSVIVAQNSSYVKGGDQIEVTAGVAAFSRKAKPIIIIDDKSIDIEVDGAAYYKFKASKNQGKHYVPVEVRFTDQEGKTQTISKSIEYTVLE